MKESGTFQVHYLNLNRNYPMHVRNVAKRGFFIKMEPSLVEKRLETLHTKSRPSPSHCTLIKRTQHLFCKLLKWPESHIYMH